MSPMLVRLLTSTWVASLVIVPLVAGAAEGVVELNQACGQLTGCAPGDAPGFPITLTAGGSYALTGDLAVPTSVDGIQLPDNASLDLRGFEIASHVTCPLGGCPAASAGSGVVGGSYVSVANGRITGFGFDCVSLSIAGRVERLQVDQCARHGIRTGSGSLVAENQIGDIGQSGISFSTALIGSTPSLYEGNSIGKTGTISVSGGRAGGPNSCFDRKCGSTGKKLFYLTFATNNGANADGACATGFHFASMWELYDPSNLEYDISIGITTAQDGQGAPSRDSGRGWIRGLVNSCGNWATSNAAVSGGLASLFLDGVSSSGPNAGPWAVTTDSCATIQSSWCVQD